VVAGRADEGEPASTDRLDRRARREQRRFVAGLRRDGVGVEPGRVVDPPDGLDVLRRVTALDVGDRRGRRLDDVEGLQERGEPLRRLGVAEGRMEARERRMA
jgi:hypothetical protein